MKKMKIIGAVIALGAASFTHAATLSWSTGAPVVDGADIANFSGVSTDADNVGGGDDGATYVAGNQTPQGQTFTTGANEYGYRLNAVTLQHVDYSTFWSLDNGWTGYNGGRFRLQIGTTSGGVFTPMTTEDAYMDASAPANQNPGIGSTQFATLVLETPVPVSANTEYAFVITVAADSDPGSTPYFELNGDGTTSANYADGEAFSLTGTFGGGDITNDVVVQTGDRVFHLDMTAAHDPTSARPTTEPIQTMDLSGTWDFTPIGQSQTSIQVPGGGWYKQGFTSVDEADYETSITIPDIGEPQVTRLEFGAVNYEAVLSIDGVVVATNIQAYTPASWDITGFVTPGDNHDIRVRVKGMGARMVAGRSIDPNGAGSWADFLPQGIFRSAELKIYPRVYLSDVFVRPSVKTDELYYDVLVRNESAGATNVTLSGYLSSWNGNAWSYPSLPSQSISLAAGAETNVAIGPVAWNPGADSYWWPNIPYKEGFQAQLHNLNLSLAPTGGGDVIHTNTTRFGFRQCTQESDGTNTCYYLNGIRVNFRGDSLQGANYDRIDNGGQGNAYDTYPGFLPGTNGWPRAVDNFQRLNYNVVRMHQIPASPYMLDVCDEMGLMIINETGIRGAGDQQDFINGHDNMVNHVKALFTRDRNHASVVRLSQSNEPDHSGTDSVGFQEDLYAAAMEVDGTRPISVDGAWNQYDSITHSNFAVFTHYGLTHGEFGQYTDEVFARSDRPYGQGEFIWPADNTPQGFTWFGTAAQAMRAKGASDIRPYTLLSAWASVIPGTSTSDMRLENPPWDSSLLYPLYGEDNLPDPWSNPQIQRVQAGFNPVLVADAEYWEYTRSSNAGGDWPASIPKLQSGASVTRTLNIYNDTFSNSAVDVFWELRRDSATGTILDSGIINATVPLGYMINQDISFTTPYAPDGTLVYLVLSTEKDGEEMFRETEQRFVLTSAAEIPLVNAGFEQPAIGKIWWGMDDPNPSYDVPGWNEVGNDADSGIEDPAFSAHSGNYAAYLNGQEDGTYQMTGYSIQDGDIITLGYWARIDWADSTCAMKGTLFYDNPAFVLGSYEAIPLGNGWSYYECTVTATVASVDHELGILFENTATDWAALDDVTLTVQNASMLLPPSAPTGLAAISSDAHVSLSWNAVSNAGSYSVQYALTNGGPYSVVDATENTLFTHSGLTNGSIYYYVVSSIGIGGESTNSVQISAVPSVAISSNEYVISDHAIEGGNNIWLTLSNSIPGHDYWVQATASLVPMAWSNIQLKAGTGSALSFTIPIDPIWTQRYFKLDVQRQ